MLDSGLGSMYDKGNYEKWIMTHATVSNLTVDELKKLIRKVVIQTFLEMFGDPDEGLELNDEFRLELQRALVTDATESKTISAQEVAAKLGLTW